MLPADLTYYGARSHTVSLRSTLFCYNHPLPSACLCLVVNVCCVLTMCLKERSVVLHILTSFSLSVLEKKLADEAIGVKKGGFICILAAF